MNRYGDVEYWNCWMRMSTAKMADTLYALIMLGGAVTDSIAVGCEKLTRKQNSYNEAELCIRLPRGEKSAFEAMTGLSLREPPKVQVN